MTNYAVLHIKPMQGLFNQLIETYLGGPVTWEDH